MAEEDAADNGNMFDMEKIERPRVLVDVLVREPVRRFEARDNVQYNSCHTVWRNGNRAGVSISKIVGASGYCTGQVRISKRTTKGMARTPKELMFFTARGPLWFTVNSSHWRTHTGEFTIIPQGEKYDLQNKSNHQTRAVYFR
ncbi:uncharacterized protein [Clytia hemisphaerica]|uniref:uncharacterized protein n=1 Tax=Clytia hemisphaerica TaxID=252671 RepID=UPI0034D6B832